MVTRQDMLMISLTKNKKQNKTKQNKTKKKKKKKKQNTFLIIPSERAVQLIIIIIKTHFIAPSIKKNDRKALYKGKIQIRNTQP